MSFHLDSLGSIGAKVPRLNETKFRYVDTPESFQELAEDLSKCRFFCVDLEDNSERSYLGMNCLIQISTMERDYVIDTLVPTIRALVPSLLPVFSDPKVLKVFHGADSDIKWLQRDFGIYVVNLFDTGQASRVLKYPSFSLAYLLMRFCNCTPNKSLQRADWRVRPLSNELLKYAREDTHYLGFIFAQMVSELVEKAKEGGLEENFFVKEVLQKSYKVSLKTYQKPLLSKDPNYQDILNRNRHILSPKKLEALRLLFTWRDKTARELDEGPFYICRDQFLFKITDVFPTSSNQLDSIRGLPPIFKFRFEEVIRIFKNVQQKFSEAAIGPVPLTQNQEKVRTISKGKPSDSELVQSELLSRIKLPQFEIDIESAKTEFLEERKTSKCHSKLFFEKSETKPNASVAQAQVGNYGSIVELLSEAYPDFASEFQEAAESMARLDIGEGNEDENESSSEEIDPENPEKKRRKKRKIKQAETASSPNHTADFLEFPKTKGPTPPPKPSKEVSLPLELPRESLLKPRTLAERPSDQALKKEKAPNMFDSITAEFQEREENSEESEEEAKRDQSKKRQGLDLNQKLSDMKIDNPFKMKAGGKKAKAKKPQENKKSSKYGTRIKDKMFFG